jgi:hypothetical protein
MISLEAPWTLDRHQGALRDLPFGKRLPSAIYYLDGEEFPIPEELAHLTGKLRDQLEIGSEFNVVKVATQSLRLSFLSYPEFFKHPHPVLQRAVTLDLAAGTIRRTDYRQRPNPPILHRKEAFLPQGHPAMKQFSALTEAEEAEGLYRDTSTIGFQRNWERLLAEKGLTYDGHRLVRLRSKTHGPTRTRPARRIERHKTAISRSEFSKPVKTLIDYGFLSPRDPHQDRPRNRSGTPDPVLQGTLSGQRPPGPQEVRGIQQAPAQAGHTRGIARAERPQRAVQGSVREVPLAGRFHQGIGQASRGIAGWLTTHAAALILEDARRHSGERIRHLESRGSPRAGGSEPGSGSFLAGHDL